MEWYQCIAVAANQVVFDSVCFLENTRTRKRFCMVLFTRATEEMEQYRHAMGEWMYSHRFSQERVRFTYILLERQH